MKSHIFVVFLLALIVGCSFPPKTYMHDTEPAMESFIGMRTQDLIAKKGPPSAVAILPSGESLWTYKFTATDFKHSSVASDDNSKSIKSTIQKIETSVYFVDINGMIKNKTQDIGH